VAFSAEQTAKNAEADHTNDPGMCLQQCRIWAGINARYPDATTAWKNTNDRKFDKRPPRGAAVYWTGGSKGFGHIAISVGGGVVRSTDADGLGRVGTHSIQWFDANWGNLTYAGWAWDINEETILHGPEEDDDMPLSKEDIEKIATAVWQMQLADLDDPKKKNKVRAGVLLSQTHNRAGDARANTAKKPAKKS